MMFKALKKVVNSSEIAVKKCSPGFVTLSKQFSLSSKKSIWNLPPTPVSYNQGQYRDGKVREYFYYIDHQGMLFLDDARMKNFTSCFKEKKFLKFFFNRVKFNQSGQYNEFPFLSPCGKEQNYIRCDDLPIVFTHIFSEDGPNKPNEEFLAYANAGEQLVVKFCPSKIYMETETGRVYHPAMSRVGGVGLVRSQLAIQLSSCFVFHNGEDQPPTHIIWNGETLELTQELRSILQSLDNVRR